MNVLKLNDGVYAVGVLNPNLRVFDVIMKTDYGTTYNAYIVKGQQKTALIETVHLQYFDEFCENLSGILGQQKIDYIVLNHTEPDHSGSLAKLTALYPDVTIVLSQAASIYIKQIANKELNLKIVKDGEELDLGGEVLKFIIAPFLHWPDSMFTFAKSSNILFTCDFLGCHYCEPRIIDKFVTYPLKYDDAFAYYYAAIFGPFKEFVLKGLEKIKDIDPLYVCPSHGPVLSGDNIVKAKAKYKLWSEKKENTVKNIPIIYASAYGCTKQLAECLAKGILSVVGDANVEILDVLNYSIGELSEKISESVAFAIGSPTINRDAVGPIWNVLSSIEAISNKGKPCFAFGSFGWSGEAVPMINERLRGLKMGVFADGFKCNFVPSEKDIEDSFNFGSEFGKTLL